MPRPGITDEKRAQMRSEIRAAAIRVLRRKKLSPGDVRGYEQVSIRDIIEEAGISIGTFYKYFKNRTELGQALWAEPVAKLKMRMQADVSAVSDPSEKVRILLEHYARFARENERVFKGAFMFIRPDGHPKPERMALSDELFYQQLHQAFLEGQGNGQFKQFDPHNMAQLFWAALHGSLALPVNLDRYEFDDPQALAAHMIDSLLNMIAAT